VNTDLFVTSVHPGRDRVGHDADDGVGLAVDPHGLADTLPVAAEVGLPERSREQSDMMVTPAVFLGREEPSQQRAQAQDLEVLGRNEPHTDLLGFLGRRRRAEVLPPGVVDDELLEGVALPSQVAGVQRRGPGRSAVPGGEDPHQSVRVCKRERAEEDRVQHREDRGVRADSERERQHGDAREGGRLAQHARRETDIEEDALERRPPPDLAGLLLEKGDVPELPAGGRQGFGARQAARGELLGPLLDVRPDLLGDVGVEAPPRKEPLEKAHASPLASTSRIPLSVRSKLEMALSTCREPAFVNR
jgi:hypothetical protein